jgi:hypothetical protein
MIFTPSDSLSIERVLMMADIDGTAGADSLDGTIGADLINGLAGDDTIFGLLGDDTLRGDSGNDTIYGGEGNDTLRGGKNADLLYGGDGDDVFLVVGDENNQPWENDTYSGGAGNDTILGSSGDDLIRLTDIGDDDAEFTGIETIDGGDGYDIISVKGDRELNAKLPGLTLLNVEELQGGNEANIMQGTDDGISMRGFNGNDTITGGLGDDSIKGDNGNDTLIGGLGADWLSGGNGNDSLDGGDGFDIAFFSGNRADYTIEESPDGSLTVTHNGGGENGVDILTDIEELQFADGIYDPTGPLGLDAKTMVEVGGSVTWKLSVSDAADTPQDMSYGVDTSATHGTVTFDGAGNYTYAPNAGFTGSDSFIYSVTDVDGHSSTATISVEVTGEFQVNTSETDGNQSDPAVAQLLGGGFVVTWHSNGSDTADDSDYGVYAQVYDANGVPGTAFLVNAGYTTSTQWQPDVASFSDGSFAIAWQSYGNDPGVARSYSIHTQLYNEFGAPVGAPLEVMSDSNLHNRYPSITALDGELGDHDYVVTWTAEKISNGDERIYAVPVIEGAKGTVVQVNTYNTDTQTHASVAGLDGGGYVIVWDSYLQDLDSWGVYGQRYDNAGVKDGGEFHISFGLTANQQKASSVEALEGGGFAVTYGSAHNASNDYDVFIQLYDAAGAPDGGAIRVNQHVSGRQHGPDIVQLGDDDLLITWESEGQDGSDRGIYARRYDPVSDQFKGDEFQVHETTAGQQELPIIAALDDGGFVITWRSDPDFDGNYEVYAKKFGSESLDGTSGNDVLLGDTVDDTLNGLAGDDKLLGGRGNDDLTGGDGDDVLLGEEGDDLLIGGVGDDVLTGGGGADVFSFSLTETSGNDSVLDFSTSEGDVLAFEDVIDSNEDMSVDINDAVTGFSKTGSEITLDIVGGGTIVVTDIDGIVNDLTDLATHVTLNGA